MNDDIIAAVATSRLEAAISIIRVSGKDCIAFVQSFFSGNLTNKKSNTINYGYIMDGDEKVDEVMVAIYRGTHTFTGEEMVEIDCHGGVFIRPKPSLIWLQQPMMKPASSLYVAFRATFRISSKT